MRTADRGVIITSETSSIKDLCDLFEVMGLFAGGEDVFMEEDSISFMLRHGDVELELAMLQTGEMSDTVAEFMLLAGIYTPGGDTLPLCHFTVSSMSFILEKVLWIMDHIDRGWRPEDKVAPLYLGRFGEEAMKVHIPKKRK